MNDAKTITFRDPILGSPNGRHDLAPILLEDACRELFRDNSAAVGRFDFVVSTKIDRPTADRPHFFIAYGMKLRDGLKVIAKQNIT